MRDGFNFKKTIMAGLTILFALNIVKQGVVFFEIKNESIEKNQELEKLKESNTRLSTELDKAQTDNTYIEKLARERLGLIKEGEKIIIPSIIE